MRIGDGTVPLTTSELASLDSSEDIDDSNDDTLLDDDSANRTSSGPTKRKLKIERIIIRNVTANQAVMVCGSIGRDLWAHVNRLEIRDNTAKDNSVMFAYAVSEKNFLTALKHQRELIEAGRVERKDS
jgi:hypothetical protein